MKTLTLACVAALIAVAPVTAAFAADEPAPAGAPAAIKPVAPPNVTPVSKKWKVGDNMPSAYVNTNSYAADVAGLGLPKAPTDHFWVQVTDNAYLVNDISNRIVRIVGVPAKQK